MAKYPVESSDQEGVIDAVNYLLSGPSGLGQNFDGFSAYLPAYLRPSTRRPWSIPIDSTLNPSVYLNIPISDAVPVGGNPSQFVTFTFATPQATAPFQYGDKLEVYDVVSTGPGEPYNFADGYNVFSCGTTAVTIITSEAFEWQTYSSGGWVGRDYLNYPITTDCYGTVTVQGATTQVFVSAQLNMAWEYDCVNAGDYNVVVSIVRERGFQSTTAGSSEYLFADPVLISEKTFIKTVTPGPGTDTLEAIFTTVLDGPNLDFGYYRYYIIVQFNVPGQLLPGDVLDSGGLKISGTKVTLVSDTTYSGLTPTSITGIGAGAILDVTLTAGDSAAYDINTNTTIDITSGGSSYAVGDILTIPGNDIGGSSPANDMNLVVESVTSTYDMTIGRATLGLRSLTAQVIKQ